MKYMRVIAGVAALGLALGGYAIVQHLHGANHGLKDAKSMVAHVGEVFKQFSAFDVDKDGQFAAGEKESLAKAIENGSLALPHHAPPKGAFPSEEERLNHMAEMYARFAAYDVNHDGDLDSTERSAVENAIENGDLQFMRKAFGASHHPHETPKSLRLR